MVTRITTPEYMIFIALVLLCCAPHARADYKDDVGFTALATELGAGLPDGSGVEVSQIEAGVQVGEDLAWMPNPINLEFTGKTLTDVTGITPGLYSSHAGGVGVNFYGSTISTSPGITSIACYLADHWLVNGFLRVHIGPGPVYQPAWSASRIGNHSWVGDADTYDVETLTRLDWVIATDEMEQIVAFNGSTTNRLLGNAYNVISVDRTSHPTNGGTTDVGGIYTSGRTKPDIVTPETSSSNATPRVSSAAALLIDAAHGNPSWSTDPAGISMTNRNGDTIYNAERVEVIKAALMSGADRYTDNTSPDPPYALGNITDYRVKGSNQTVNGLDKRFGAGQLNIYNGYHIVAAGEHNSLEDHAAGGGLIGSNGFDYDPSFGGSGGSNTTATYYFAQTAGPVRLAASLVWNLKIDGGTPNNFDGAATLYDFDLQLFDVTDPGHWILVGSSSSTNENTENLWLRLDGGKDYALRVIPGAGQAAFDWDYALAWQAKTIQPLTLEIGWAPQTGTLGQFYWWEGLTVSGGEPPYAWEIIQGWIQWPMTLNQNGVISGIPSEVSTAYFTVEATDANSDTATVQSQITVNNPGYVCGGCHSDAGL